MRSLTLSVVRKNRQMKWRVIGISLLMAWAVGMFAMGLYGAEVFDASVESQVESTNFPDVFIDLDVFIDQASVVDELDSMVENGSIENYQLRLVLQGHYWYEGVRYPAYVVGLEDPSDESINRIIPAAGSMNPGAGEGVAQTGMEDEGLVLDSEANLTVLGQSLPLDIVGMGASTEFLMTGTVSMGGFSLPGGVAIVFTPLDHLQTLEVNGTAIGAMVNSVALISDDPVQAVMELEQFFATQPGDLVTDTVYRESHPSITFLRAGADEFRYIMPVMSVLFLTVGAVAILMVFQRMVQNDSRFIGVLMSMGYTNREIMKGYLGFGLVIGTIASVLGALLGFLITVAMLDIFAQFFGEIEFVLPLVLYPFVMAAVIAYTFVLLAMLLPLSQLRKLTPREALEYHKDNKVFVSSRKVGRSRLSVMGVRNAFRVPKQTLATMIAIGLAVGVAGSWLVLADSSMNYIEDQLGSDNWDVEINFQNAVDADMVKGTYLGLDEGSFEAFPFRAFNTQTSNGERTSPAYVTAGNNLSEVRSFSIESGEVNLSGAVIAITLAKDLGLKVGDDITLGASLVLPVTAIVQDIMEIAVYTDLDNLPDNQSVNGAFLVLGDDLTPKEARQLLYENGNIITIVLMGESWDAINEMMGEAMELYYAFFFLNGIIAFIVAAATVTIIAAEREMEYATMKSLGINKKEMAWPIIVEMSILAVGAVVVGLPAAFVFADFLIGIYQEVVMYFPIAYTMFGIVFTVVLGLFFTMAAAIVPIRHANKVDVEKVIRERTSG